MKKNGTILIKSLNCGGAEKNSINLANFLAVNYEIELIVFQEKNSYLKFELDPRIKIKELRCSNKLEILLKLYFNVFWEKSNFIISFDPFASCFINLFRIIKNKKIKIISRCINTLGEQEKVERVFWLKKYLKQVFYKKTYKMSDFLIAQSIGMKDDLINNYGIDIKKIINISNSVDIKKVEKLKKETILKEEEKYFLKKTIISVGRLVEQKNYNFLIELIKELKSKGREINLIILGEGEKRKELEKKIKEYQLEDRVFLLGFKKNPYIYIQRANFFWLSSFYEGFPNVLLDAIFCNTVIISNDCKSGPREIISQGEERVNKTKFFEKYKYGYLYFFKDFSKNKNHFIKELEEILFNSEKENSKISKNYSELKNKYSLKIQLNKYISLIEEKKNDNGNI